ncbi:GNAT family N-acetyltransferase [Polynucleobacter sp. MWH-UH19D]|uniref:GNAT family N-acetyltransferase n=1 Tax=Polynucleobacter sp. MWH-UH19D TaxID=1855610 RepID=UPI003364E14A
MKTFDKDQWLSSILGKNVFQVDSKFASQLTPSHLPQGPALVMVKVPVSNIRDCKHLQGLNFFLVDTNIQLQKLRDKSGLLVNSMNVRFANPSDEEAILKIAANSFTYDRFHGDPGIAHKTAEKIKVEWAQNYFRGSRGDWMVVAEDGGIVSGFLQLLHGQDGVLIIDLIAVGANYRHKGVAQKMIGFAIQNCEAKIDIVKVGTQIANLPSISLYLKMGFYITSAHYIFHCHL